MATIKLFDILWNVKHSGPSPYNNRRTELYFAGCRKARDGNPCKNCFNTMIWRDDNINAVTPEQIVETINKHNVPKYITLVGGEPTDQLAGLLELAKLLREQDYHLMLFSWRSKEWLQEKMGGGEKLFNIIVTEPYDYKQHIYDIGIDDGIHDVIGSGNQIIWQPKEDDCYYARDVRSLILTKDNRLKVVKY